MKRTYDNLNSFYQEAMKEIYNQLGNKLKALGVQPDEVPKLSANHSLVRVQTKEDDETITERYEYNGIKLIEVVWNKQGVEQVDINKDERDIRGIN